MLEFGVSLLDFCVTSNHAHLMVYAEESQPISAFMQKVEGEFAQAYNRRHHRSGAFWSDRFHSTIIEPGRHLEQCLVYIDLNMVRCGVVPHPREWPWCGHNELMGLRRRYRLLDLEQLLSLLGACGAEQFRTHYAAMIEERIARNELSRESRWTESVAVGSEGFVREIESRIRGRQQMEVVSQANCWILREVGTVYETSPRL